MEKDAEEFIEETIEHQSDTVYDYQLDIDCTEMPITIDELSIGVGNSNDMVIDGGKPNSKKNCKIKLHVIHGTEML